jgi:hypothetical protein
MALRALTSLRSAAVAGVKGTGRDYMNSALVKRQAPVPSASAQQQKNSFDWRRCHQP